MAIRSSRLGALCLLMTVLLLAACAGVDAGLKKAVVIKYVHVANVTQFQGSPDGVNQRLLAGVNPGSFWAVFDVCSIDVQGNSLAGMQYEAHRFVANAGTGTYGPHNPGPVNLSGTGTSSDSPPVVAAVQDAFAPGPASQFYPNGFYPGLKSRVVIFVKEAPAGYHGEAVTLRYNGEPEVAAIVQNAGGNTPAVIAFYPGKSTGIGSTCP